MRRIFALNAATATAPAPQPNTCDIRDAQTRLEIRQLWARVVTARAAFQTDPARFPELAAAVDAFFALERQSIRYQQRRRPTTAGVTKAKAHLLAQLRERGAFVWHNGAIDDYYPQPSPGRTSRRAPKHFGTAFHRGLICWRAARCSPVR